MIVKNVFSEKDLSSLKKFATENVSFRDENEDIPLFRKSGAFATYMRNYKGICQNTEISYSLFKFFVSKFEKEIDQEKIVLLGVQSPGVPIAAQISSFAFAEFGKKISVLFSRERRKKYGTCSLIDGDVFVFDNEKHILVIVDDIINSGASATSAFSNFLNERHLPQGDIEHFFFSLLGYGKELSGPSYSPILVDEIEPTFSSIHIAKRFGDKAELRIVDKNKIDWSFQTRVTNTWGVTKGRPLIQKGLNQIIINSDSAGIICLDLETGEKRWNIKTTNHKKGVVSAPQLFQDDFLIYGDYGGQINIVNYITGKLVFSEKICNWIGSTPCLIGEYKFAIGLEYKGDQTNDFKGSIAMFEIEEGIDENYSTTFSLKKIWEKYLNQYQHSSPSYSESNNLIISGSNDGVLMGLNAENGNVAWEKDIGSPMKSFPAIHKKVSIIGAFDGNIYIFRNDTGEILKSIETKDIVYLNPLIYEDRCYLGSADGTFFTLNLEEGKEGEVISSFFSGGKIHCEASLNINDGKIYFGNNNGILTRANLDGEPERFFHVGERLTNKIVFDGENNAYILNNLNKLIKIKSEHLI